MLGAVAGDIIGSVYEFDPTKRTDFSLFSKHSSFTDDTVLTMAVAESLLTGRPYQETLREFALAYPDRGFGSMFWQWFTTPGARPYNSFGNGSAMRVSPVGWAFNTLEETMAEAQRSAEVTHNHPEGIKGAQSVAAAIFMARQGLSQSEIRDALETRFGYNLHRTYEEIQPSCSFDETCQRSVPEALICVLGSTSFEDAIRRAVALGADADTQAAIAGSVAEALYGGVPKEIAREARARLTLQFIDILDAFQEKYHIARA
ncbi:MAG: ADP-ribosylglycohydrolase family protein [Candidatus Cryosericum sp.]|nr:ADP-ribosylglycohydrolase family protein [bacterium]